MSLLPEIATHLVKTGWWWNLTAPPYRQFLWTTTNIKAVLIVGILAVLGGIAGDRLWIIIRHYSQPAREPSDLDSRAKFSRTDSIRALWTEINAKKQILKNKFSKTHGSWVKHPGHQPLHSEAKNIQLRFGFLAITNAVAFVVLSNFIPFFLTEGLQGQAIVQNTSLFMHTFWWQFFIFTVNEKTHNSVHWSIQDCVTEGRIWSQSENCANIRNALPPYSVESLDLTNRALANPPYHVLAQYGNKNFRALRLSRYTSLQNIGFNVDGNGRKLHHELTCVPLSLDPFVTQVNGSYNLDVEDLIPFPSHESESHELFHKSMILRTSNAPGSGKEILDLREKLRAFDIFPPIENHGAQGAKFYQNNVDSALPYIELQEWKEDNLPHHIRHPMEYIEKLSYDDDHRRLKNFLITFKPGESYYAGANMPSNDPIFGTYLQRNGMYVADREVSALACTEVFKSCLRHNCTELYNTGESNLFNEGPDERWSYIESKANDFYPSVMSVWAAALVDSVYDMAAVDSGISRRFFAHPYRRQWQHEVEERFIHSMLRVQYITKYAAEQNMVTSLFIPPKDLPKPSFRTQKMLYGNSDHTNINLIGYTATLCGYLYIIAGSYWLVLFWPLAHPIKSVCMAARLYVWMYGALSKTGRKCIGVIRMIRGAKSRDLE